MIPLALAGQAIGAASNLAGGITSMIQNRQNQIWQENMYSKQVQDNRDNWNANNKYNEEMYNKYQSPEAIMRQLQEAGLNPYLYYQGKGSVQGVQASQQASSGQHGSPAQFDVGEQFARLGGTMQGMLNYGLEKRKVDSQMKNDEVQRQSIAASTLKTNEDRLFIIDQRIIANEKLLLDKSLNKVTVDRITQETENLKADKDRIVAQTANISRQTQNIDHQEGIDDRNLKLKEAQFKWDKYISDFNAKTARITANSNAAVGQSVIGLNEANTSLSITNKNVQQALGTKYWSDVQKAMKDMNLTDAQRQVLEKKMQLMDLEIFKSTLDAGVKPITILRGIIGLK